MSPSGTSMCGVDECMENKEGACSYHDGRSWRDCAEAVRVGCRLRPLSSSKVERGYRRSFQGHSVSHAARKFQCRTHKHKHDEAYPSRMHRLLLTSQVDAVPVPH